MAKKILVVDDDADMVELVCASLKNAGFVTGSASNGVDALKKARSFCPDLVLLDLMLPEMDGFAVCETLRRERGPTLPIVMLTGLPGELPRIAGVESGATDYIRKPFGLEDLVSRVRDLLLQAPHASPASKSPAAKA